MLIFNSPKMIFIHLQRSGGSSVEISLSPAKRWNDVIIGSTQLGESVQWLYFGEFGLHKHSTAAEVRQVVGEQFWMASYRWATIRNPFDILCSLFGSVAAEFEPLLAADPRFPAGAAPEEVEQWIESDIYPKDIPWTRPAARAYLRARGTENPMSLFLRDPDLDAEAAMWPQFQRLCDNEGHLVIDEYVKLHSLGARWPRLLQRVGLPELALRYANPTPEEYRVSRGPAYRDPLDVEWVVTRFRLDFESFGFPTDPWTMERPSATETRGHRARTAVS